jgi:serine/threonine-protein kinase
LITDSDVAKLTDFGIARLFGTTLNNKSGQRYGTPIYSSPEQILGLSPDLRSDIYSFGIMTFRMLTGILPFSFDIDNSIKKETLLTESAINFPTDIDKKTKNFIDLFILKAIKRDVEMRYQTVLEMLEVLDNIDESI